MKNTFATAALFSKCSLLRPFHLLPRSSSILVRVLDNLRRERVVLDVYGFVEMQFLLAMYLIKQQVQRKLQSELVVQILSRQLFPAGICRSAIKWRSSSEGCSSLIKS
jgi:hypothetical protein